MAAASIERKIDCATLAFELRSSSSPVHPRSSGKLAPRRSEPANISLDKPVASRESPNCKMQPRKSALNNFAWPKTAPVKLWVGLSDRNLTPHRFSPSKLARWPCSPLVSNHSWCSRAISLTEGLGGKLVSVDTLPSSTHVGNYFDSVYARGSETKSACAT